MKNHVSEVEISDTNARSILTKSKLPDADYVINPYIGCSFACTYCYASFMGRMVGKKPGEWGTYVHPKTNAAELLAKEIEKVPKKGKGTTILLSSVTDPYLEQEATYKITRGCLETLAKYGFEGVVSILTKSPLVLRDIDLLKKLPRVEVGMTITSTDDAISRYFEQRAPSVSSRLKALTTLNAEGISTYAFIGPLLPHFVTKEDKLDALCAAIKETGTTDVYVEHINLKKYILDRLKAEMPDLDQTILDTFYGSQHKEYRKQLDTILMPLLDKHGLHLRLDEAIYHNEPATEAS